MNLSWKKRRERAKLTGGVAEAVYAITQKYPGHGIDWQAVEGSGAALVLFVSQGVTPSRADLQGHLDKAVEGIEEKRGKQ